MSKSVFLLGATGFIGHEVLRALREDPSRVVRALARTDQAAAMLTGLGAQPVLGDLGREGEWRAQVGESDVVIHAAQPAAFGKRITRAVARRYEAERLAMDARLFAALPKDRSVRLIYVAGNSFYGETGSGAPKDESMAPHPTGFGPYITAAVAAAEGVRRPNLEVVTVFPGSVYGKGSWLKQYFLDPIAAGKPVMRVAGEAHWASPIHVEDCGRAIVHLSFLDSARLQQRYFLVDDQPTTFDELAALCAKAMGKPLKLRSIPGWMLGLFAGEIARSYMQTDSKYSNARLRASDFVPRFPSVATGIPQLLT